MKKQDQFLTAQEASEVLKVNIMTIYRYIKSGKLSAYKVGKAFRIKNRDFETFMYRQRVKPK